MALYSKRQFADLAGVPSNNLSNYIKRGHVLLKSGKPCKCQKNKCTCLIDSGDPKNAVFLQQRGINDQAVPATEAKPAKAAKITFGGTDPAPTGKKTRLLELQEQKLENQNREAENRIRLLEAKIQKAYEEVVPRDFADFMIKNYSVGIADVWLTATERFLMQKGTALGLSREEVIEHRKYITEILNDAKRKGAEEAINNMRKVAREYAGRKDRGVRED